MTSSDLTYESFKLLRVFLCGMAKPCGWPIEVLSFKSAGVDSKSSFGSDCSLRSLHRDNPPCKLLRGRCDQGFWRIRVDQPLATVGPFYACSCPAANIAMSIDVDHVFSSRLSLQASPWIAVIGRPCPLSTPTWYSSTSTSAPGQMASACRSMLTSTGRYIHTGILSSTTPPATDWLMRSLCLFASKAQLAREPPCHRNS